MVLDLEQCSYPIKGFKDYYITPTGEVFSTKVNPCREKVQTLSRKGYPRVTLYQDSKTHTIEVHRLMARTFLNVVKGQQINHKDGNKLNNRLENLEVVSASENMLHAYRTGLHTRVGINNPAAKLTESSVKAIRKLLLQSDLTQKEIGILWGIHKDTVSNIKTGKTWRHVL